MWAKRCALGVAGASLLAAASGCAPILGIEDTVYEAPSPECALVPQRIFFASKIHADIALTVAAITQKDFGRLASDLDTELVADRGHVLAAITNCGGDDLLEDATLSIEPAQGDATSFSIDDSGVLLGSDTSAAGRAGALNVATPTELALEAYPDELTGGLGSVGDIATEPGVIGFVVLEPNEEGDPIATPPEGFGCVGMAPPPPANADARITIDVYATTNLAPTGQPLPGVRVRYCIDGPEPCAIDLSLPLDSSFEATSDASGRATLRVPTPAPEGFDGSVLLAGHASGCD